MQYRPHRYNTDYPADLMTPTGPQRAKVTDVHNAGAQLTGLRGLRRGDKIRMKILHLQAEAVVQWTAAGRAGISFRPQITDDQVDTLRYRRDGRNRMYPGSVGYRYAEMR